LRPDDSTSLSPSERENNAKIIQAVRRRESRGVQPKRDRLPHADYPQRVSKILRDSLEKMRDLVRKALTLELA
jgi:hypothetical protein